MSSSNQAGPIVFHSLVVERFRGFNKRADIPLDASAVIVSGANGQGKTSLFDAIQWLVLGRIERLEGLRFRKNEEHLVNRYAPIGSKAQVQARIKDASSGNWVTVTRTGDHRGSILEAELDGELIVGQKAEKWLKQALGVSTAEESTFEQYFLSAALLQQDLVRSFLSTYTHAERYEVLSRLLGLSVIDDFIDRLAETEKHIGEQVKSASTELQQADASVAKAEQDIRESKARIETAPVLSDVVKQLEEGAASLDLTFLLDLGRATPKHGTQLVLTEINQCKQRLQTLDELIDATQAHFAQKPTLTAEQLGETVTKVKTELDEENSKLKDERAKEREYLEMFEKVRSRTDELRQLASLAIPMLTDRCPVCSQKIDADDVQSRLQSLLAEQPEFVKAKNQYEKVKKTVARRAKRISDLEEEYRDAVSVAEIARSWRRRTERLDEELREVSDYLDKLGFPRPIPQANVLIEWLPTVRNWAPNALARLRTLEQLVEKAIAAESAVEESKRLSRLEADLNRAKGLRSEKQSVADNLEKSLAARRDVTELARQKATEVVHEAFDELEPVVQDLFCRLAPHPTFDRLSFTHELYRKRGSSIPLAIDQQTNLEVSPAIGFSSAQANVAALCYFLALAFASSEADFGFVLLDDPLQAMDDVNVLGFSDLCRFLRKEKQLIIATHEERLSNLLVRKLRSRDEPISTIRLNFTSWNRSGPYIDIERISSRPEVSVLASLA